MKLSWLEVSYKAPIEVLARNVVSSQDSTGKISFQDHSCDYWQSLCPYWLLARDVSSFPHGLFHRTTHNTAISSLRMRFLRKSGREMEAA